MWAKTVHSKAQDRVYWTKTRKTKTQILKLIGNPGIFIKDEKNTSDTCLGVGGYDKMSLQSAYSEPASQVESQHALVLALSTQCHILLQTSRLKRSQSLHRLSHQAMLQTGGDRNHSSSLSKPADWCAQPPVPKQGHIERVQQDGGASRFSVTRML